MSRADRWEEGFRKLVAHTELHGNSRVPASTQFDGYDLGRWVRRQRRRYDDGTLDSDRQTPTVNADSRPLPGWTWDPFADTWEDGYGRMLDYFAREGHARVPDSYTVVGYRLGV